MTTDPAPVTVGLRKPLLTPRGLVTRLTLREPTREDLDVMELATSMVMDGVVVPIGEAAPNLIEDVSMFALLGSMTGVEPAEFVKLCEDDRAAIFTALDGVMRAAIDRMRSA